MNNKIINILSAHQPAFLPWAGFIEKIGLSEVFIIMDIAKFRNRAFMHRNRIEINNKPFFLGLHLAKGSDVKRCNEIFINPNFSNDLKDISNKIKMTYMKSKFFNDVENFCYECLDNIDNKLNLVEITTIQIKFLIKQFKFKTELKLESSFLNEEKMQNLDASRRLLEHAKYFNAKCYVTGINSSNYLDKSIFDADNITNFIQKFNYDPYLRYQKSDMPLSIVHQIANIGLKNMGELLNKNIETTKEEIRYYEFREKNIS